MKKNVKNNLDIYEYCFQVFGGRFSALFNGATDYLGDSLFANSWSYMEYILNYVGLSDSTGA